jgi:hypothetical protein
VRTAGRHAGADPRLSPVELPRPSEDGPLLVVHDGGPTPQELFPPRSAVADHGLTCCVHAPAGRGTANAADLVLLQRLRSARHSSRPDHGGCRRRWCTSSPRCRRPVVALGRNLWKPLAGVSPRSASTADPSGPVRRGDKPYPAPTLPRTRTSIPPPCTGPRLPLLDRPPARRAPLLPCWSVSNTTRHQALGTLPPPDTSKSRQARPIGLNPVPKNEYKTCSNATLLKPGDSLGDTRIDASTIVVNCVFSSPFRKRSEARGLLIALRSLPRRLVECEIDHSGVVTILGIRGRRPPTAPRRSARPPVHRDRGPRCFGADSAKAIRAATSSLLKDGAPSSLRQDPPWTEQVRAAQVRYVCPHAHATVLSPR